MLFTSALILALFSGAGASAPPWVAPPVRGWNSWTAYGCGVTDADLRATADALVSTGLAAAGYTIVAPDDCWAASRDPITGERCARCRYQSSAAS